jgi:hypothetical protein
LRTWISVDTLLNVGATTTGLKCSVRSKTRVPITLLTFDSIHVDADKALPENYSTWDFPFIPTQPRR